MRKVVLAYHSVGSRRTPAVAGSFPVAMDRFVAQVRGLRDRGWRFGRLSELRESADGDTVYVTGDDGTADWAANVLPWCEGEGVPTHTALITGVWADPPVWPVAHRVQAMLAVTPPGRLPRPPLADAERAYIDRIYAYETDPLRRYLKGACNVLYDFAQADALLGAPDAACADLLAARFAPAAAYKRFALAEVGPHTVSHAAYAGDAAAYLAGEVEPCRAAIARAGLTPTHYFTLPVKPRDGAGLRPLCDRLSDAGYLGLLTDPGEWDRCSFVVPRIDAKDVERFFGLPTWSK